MTLLRCICRHGDVRRIQSPDHPLRWPEARYFWPPQEGSVPTIPPLSSPFRSISLRMTSSFSPAISIFIFSCKFVLPKDEEFFARTQSSVATILASATHFMIWTPYGVHRIFWWIASDLTLRIAEPMLEAFQIVELSIRSIEILYRESCYLIELLVFLIRFETLTSVHLWWLNMHVHC